MTVAHGLPCDAFEGRPMTLRRHWVESGVRGFEEDLTDNGPDGHLIQYSVELPSGARALKLVCGGGISIWGKSSADLSRLGKPMTWDHVVTLAEGPSTEFPIGRILPVNEQAGSLKAALAFQPQLDTTVAGTTVPFVGIPQQTVITYGADIQLINQSMSYGTIHEPGVSRVFGGAHNTTFGNRGMDGLTSSPRFLCSSRFVLRVLYELDE
jgi:hypothetical protein